MSANFASKNNVGITVMDIMSVEEMGILYTSPSILGGKNAHTKSKNKSIFNCLSLRDGVFGRIIVNIVCKHSIVRQNEIKMDISTGSEHKYTVTKFIHC